MTILKHGSLLLKTNTQELSVVKNITFDDPQIQLIEPVGASRKIRLPPVADNISAGLVFFIANTSTIYSLLIHTDLSEGEELITIINPKDNSIFICDDQWSGSIGSTEGVIDILQMQVFS